MQRIKQGSVLDSDSYVITEQEKQLISVVFKYFKDILPEIIEDFDGDGSL